MFKNRKLEVRIVKDDARGDKVQPTVEEPKPDYVAIAEEAAARLGKKLIIGICTVVVVTVVTTMLADIAVNAMDNTIDN